jgi:glycerate 2-kinase
MARDRWIDQWPEQALFICHAVLSEADPARALRKHWAGTSGPAWLLATGKAGVALAREGWSLIGPNLQGGLLTAPEPNISSAGELPIHALPCDHPLPTVRNVEAAATVLDFVSRVPAEHTLVILVSGGASAHLCLPAGALSLDDIVEATRVIQRAGATIRELNTVRKHCERLKGGQLAAACSARIDAYILSDVLGSPLDVIASGPTAPDPTTYDDALSVLERRALTGRLPKIVRHLQQGRAGDFPETRKPGDPVFDRVRNVIIADNTQAVRGACAHLERAGFRVMGEELAVEGEAADVGRRLALRAGEIARSEAPSAHIIGGEWTVTVGEARGHGGPSQELALAAAEVLADSPVSAGILAFSTDGIDGPTDAAGAFITSATWYDAIAAGLDPRRALREHDSHSILDRAGLLIRTGPTGTNVNHVGVLVVVPDKHHALGYG